MGAELPALRSAMRWKMAKYHEYGID